MLMMTGAIENSQANDDYMDVQEKLRREFRAHRLRLQVLDSERAEIIHAMQECEIDYKMAGGELAELN